MLFKDEGVVQGLTLKLSTTIEESFLKNMHELMPSGRIPLQISFSENGSDLVLNSTRRVKCDAETLKKLETSGIEINLSV